MKYGWLSGFLWALDTVLLGMVLSTLMPDESFRSAVWIVPLVSAWFHDLFSACWLFLLTLLSGKLGQLKKACCTRHGLVVVVAAVLGGPVGSVRISVSGEVIPGAAQRGCPLYLRCSMPDLMR